jgi:hypothetical protein
MPRSPADGTVNSAYNGQNDARTHDHSVERNKDAALGPVGLAVGRDIVHEEARADEERDFE